MLLLVITVVVFQIYLTNFIRHMYINNLEESLLTKAELVGLTPQKAFMGEGSPYQGNFTAIAQIGDDSLQPLPESVDHK